jgi:hypothetical protein
MVGISAEAVPKVTEGFLVFLGFRDESGNGDWIYTGTVYLETFPLQCTQSSSVLILC